MHETCARDRWTYSLTRGKVFYLSSWVGVKGPSGKVCCPPWFSTAHLEDFSARYTPPFTSTWDNQLPTTEFLP